ncbi:hypothetical protein P154DRAFT_21295 [Amniculicola lignicola CBS 123094]|uniref:Zn(2)-C6 fungal-type domain-containing protein n=1 Tax=Amniculicola lignicola CBS 123094 TaxID=1392246 RepID=A0A6A5WT57_9PLEO|nr:hypothetical protein P154DRAFT_21295 [Amniculicola lignicola CBS 123094]
MSIQASKDNRSGNSCSECQRRKQKCSREWPCNHCQARKVPHLCQFGSKKSQHSSPGETSLDAKAQKRSISESNDESPFTRDRSQENAQDSLKAWGYMPGHVHFNLGHIEQVGQTSSHTSSSMGPDSNHEVERVLHVIPQRSLTDAIVSHFLTVVNYRYNSIYAPTFTEQYVRWWADRAQDRKLSTEFTCLLLRVCSYSVQYLSTVLRKTIEFELACSYQTLTERFSRAADQLSASFSPSEISVERVQEQFLRGAWLKSESKIVESWHALGCSIRAAQELGLDKERTIEGLSEFDVEIRRRLWTLLYIWDWQMSAWLGRPHMIDQRNCSFIFPSLRLDGSKTDPDLLSPFAHIALQAQLARRVAMLMGDTESMGNLSAQQVFAIESDCEDFLTTLPSIFRFEDPVLRLDGEHPYYVFQRCQLHVVIYMTMFDPLKPYLTREPKQSASPYDDRIRAIGVDVSLKLLKASRVLFDHEFPINARFHLVVFCLFDTATTLCSAMIHDVDSGLPGYEEIMDAVEDALGCLHQLSLTTKLGALSYKFLYKLVHGTSVLSRHDPQGKRQRTSSGIPKPPQPPPNDLVAPAVPVSTAPMVDAVLQQPTTDDLSFDLDQFLQQNPLDTSVELDFGGLEEIWTYGDLNLDSFLNQGSEGNEVPQ